MHPRSLIYQHCTCIFIQPLENQIGKHDSKRNSDTLAGFCCLADKLNPEFGDGFCCDKDTSINFTILETITAEIFF